jgi:virulence-associated protein VapD
MSAAIYLVTELHLADLPSMDGKQLSNAFDDLDFLAEKLGLELPSSFLYVTKDEIEDVGVDLMDFMMPQTEWFEAEIVLETVFALRVHLEKHPNAIPSSESVLIDLKSLELALEICEAKGVAVRLTIDI